jgi:hypothetical protein
MGASAGKRSDFVVGRNKIICRRHDPRAAIGIIGDLSGSVLVVGRSVRVRLK